MPSNAARVVNLSSAEGTWGAENPVVRVLHGVTEASLKIADTIESPHFLGWIGHGPLSAETQQHGEGSLDLLATYEEAPVLLNMFFTAIGASTSAAAPYSYPYVAPVQTTQVVHTLTMEYGTAGAAYTALGNIGTELTIKGEAGGMWNMSVATLSKNIIASSSGMASAFATKSVRPVRMADTTLSIDAFSTGTMGATAVSATLASFELGLKTGRHLKTFAGSLTPTAWGDGVMEGSLKLTAEFNASAKALVDEMLSTATGGVNNGSTGTFGKRQIRISATQATSSGLTVGTFTLDFAGVKTEGETLFSDRDRNMTVDLTYQGLYSTALGNWFAATVVNGTSSTT